MTRRDWAFVALLTFGTMLLFLPPAMLASWAYDNEEWWAFTLVILYGLLGVGLYLAAVSALERSRK